MLHPFDVVVEANDNGFFASTLFLAFCIISLLMIVLAIVGMWKLFTKAGEAGWASLIPFYNGWVLMRIATGSGILSLLYLIPIVNVVIGIYQNIRLGTAFGKGALFTVGLVLFPGIFYLVLGFDGSIYYGPNGPQFSPAYVNAPYPQGQYPTAAYPQGQQQPPQYPNGQQG